ncbi:hypothetical protein JPM7_2190 [Metamycoplasma equirhinis]|uniref:hypothetical protein n=1 Tax=Metamycoplasma equirhinis TaxID=92402 RepID=UPI0025725B13|nr:hypothetical protein [Metamycoplasma equirhinis]BDX52612.1 hypothetical protein JPM7_2190 [Metamycoplasma equirhinis]
MNKNEKLYKGKLGGYFQNSWTKATIVYYFISTIFWTLLVFLIRFAYIESSKLKFAYFIGEATEKMHQKDWQTSISISAGSCLCLNILIVLIRKGMGRGIFRPFIDFYRNRVIANRLKNQISPGATLHEKDILRNKIRREYDKEINQKALNRNLEETNNLVFYVLIGYSVLAIVSLIPIFALHINW